MTCLPQRDDRERCAPGATTPRAGRPACWAARLWLPFALAWALIGNPTVRAQEAELEYKVKAAFLFNFLKFTQWPTNKYAPAEPSMVVGCLADDPAGPMLVKAFDGKTVNGLPIKLTIFKDADDARNCHLLFLGRARKAEVEEALARLKQAPVLTVGEVDQFAQRGGMINLVRHERTFRFEINLEVAERARLRISSDLSGMATIIKTRPAP